MEESQGKAVVDSEITGFGAVAGRVGSTTGKMQKPGHYCIRVVW